MIVEIDAGNGQIIEIEAPSLEAAQQAAATIGASAGGTPPPRGVANNLGGGIAEGAINLATLPRTALDLSTAGWRWAGEKVLGRPLAEPQYPFTLIPKMLGPTAQELKQGLEPITGPFPHAGTTEEKYAKSIGEFVPGGAGPGNLVRKLAQYVVAPGVGAEYLGSRAEGTPYEGIARLLGGVGGVAAGGVAGAGYTAAKNRLAAGDTGRELGNVTGSRVGPGAASRLGRSLEADQTTGASAAATLDNLGPEAMVLDTGRQMRGRAEAIAAQPGRGQNVVLDAVENRTGTFGEGTSARVAQTLDRELGQSHDVVRLVDQTDALVDRIARPLYRQVMDAHPVVWDARIESLAQRPAIAAAMRDARELAGNYGETLSAIDATTRPSLRHWDYVKKVLDARIRAYHQSGHDNLGSADKADLGGLQQARRDLVTALDEITEGAYREARMAAAHKPQLREALQFGRDGFNKNILPEEFAAELAEMSVPQQHMARAGYRRELDRLIQTTRNEGATARRILDENSNLQKIELLFGPDEAAAIARRISAENVFQEATTNIARNSRTAVRQELIKDTATPSTGDVRGTSLPGLAHMGLRAAGNYLWRHGMEGTRGQIGDVLTQSGEQISPVVLALERMNRRRAANAAPVGAPEAAIINALAMVGNRDRKK